MIEIIDIAKIYQCLNQITQHPYILYRTRFKLEGLLIIQLI